MTDPATAAWSEAPTAGASPAELAAVMNAHGGPLNTKMGVELLSVSAAEVTGRMPVAGNEQPYGLLHGGGSCVFAETLASVGAAMHAGPGRIAVGTEINATHHRAGRSGFVHGVATAIHRGRTSASYEIVITDDEGKRVCTARVSCAIRGAVPGG